MTLDEEDRQALAHVLTDAAFPELPNFQRGKVRESYDLPDGRRIMIATDRQSAFDQVLAAVPFKGQVLTQTARFWFEATAELCPNHVLGYPDPNVVVGRRLDMLPVELVVRDYLTGSTETSIWTMYARGERRLYGHLLPDGLRKNQKLAKTLITPTTKGASGAHDSPVTPEEILDRGLMTSDQWDETAARTLAVFARGREVAAENGLILVDSKFEFGLDPEGRVVLADEILTPDSSRYWRHASYGERMARGAEPESLDKEFLRLWIRERCDPYSEPIPEIPAETLIAFSRKFVALYETVTGRSFQHPSPGSPIRERIRENLVRAFPELF